MFTVSKGIYEPNGYELIVMKGEGHEVRILPQNGFNLWYWTYEGKEILMKPVDISVFGTKYGIPLLFPTPNRIRNSVYTWEGQEYVMQKRGEKIPRHGLVKDEPFTVTKLEAHEDCAVCEAEIEIVPGSDLYEGYPFACKLTVAYTLSGKGLHMDVYVDNKGERTMPFGFCCHPYFSKRGDASKVFLTVPAKRLYEVDEEGIPSGRIMTAEGGDVIWDEYHDVESLYLDRVYRGMTGDMESKIRYKDVIVHISASDCFRNVVVFTPHDRPGFCIEPQTNATDFINMHARGQIDESAMLTLPAGRRFEAYVDMTVEKQF